jgi:hypothetical protein
MSDAVFFLLDNSLTSLNADFAPTRLKAQFSTIESVGRSLLQGNRESAAGFGTLAGDFGVKCSLTTKFVRVLRELERVEREPTLYLAQGIRSGLLAVSNSAQHFSRRRLFIFVASPHTLTVEESDGIARDSNLRAVELHVFAFGPDPPTDSLRHLCSRSTGGSFNRIVGRGIELWSAVQQAMLGEPARPPADNYDEDLRRVLEETRTDLDESPELQAAIAASLAEAQPADAEDEMDEETQQALVMSMMDQQPGGGAPQNGGDGRPNGGSG